MIPLLTTDLPPQPEEAIHASLVEYVIERCAATRVDIHWLGIDPTLTANADRLAWTGNPCRSRPMLRLSLVENENLAAEFSVRPSLTVWKQAPVAIRDFKPNEVVQSTLAEVPMDSLRGRPTTDMRVASVFIKQGTPITDAVTTVPPAARAGSTVDLKVQRGTLTITAPGKLLHDADLGQTVRVVNEATHVTLKGVLVEPGVVDLP
jgi:flagella basal body P-ring formation protein FlgA